MDFVLRLAGGDAELNSLDRHDLVLGLPEALEDGHGCSGEPNGCAMIQIFEVDGVADRKSSGV